MQMSQWSNHRVAASSKIKVCVHPISILHQYFIFYCFFYFIIKFDSFGNGEGSNIWRAGSWELCLLICENDTVAGYDSDQIQFAQLAGPFRLDGFN